MVRRKEENALPLRTCFLKKLYSRFSQKKYETDFKQVMKKFWFDVINALTNNSFFLFEFNF